MTTQQMVFVLQAFEDGKSVQFKDRNKCVWNDFRSGDIPAWDFGRNDYRVKPTQAKPREYWIELGNTLYVGDPNPRSATIHFSSKTLHGGEIIHVREILD